MNIERSAIITASAGIFIACLAFAYQQVAPLLSEHSCVIHGVRGSGEAAGHVTRACRSRFEHQTPEEEELPQLIWSKLEGRAGFHNGVVVANLYNGNSLYTITRIRVGVTDPATADSEEPVTHYYDARVNIPPLSSTREEFLAYQAYENVHWQIIKAWGYDAGK